MPEASDYLSTRTMSLGVADMPSAPLRFLEAWIQTILGFFVCIVLPILVYAQSVPFADGSIGVAERTILATALAYAVVIYCGNRLESFPNASLMDQAAYIAPIVTVCFATIAVGLLALRLEYSRVQFFGSGFLLFLWVLGAAHLRVRLFTRSYAIVPAASLATMPGVKSCRWLHFEDAVARSVRLDGIVADLSNGLSERELSELARAAIAGMPVLDRRYIVESLTGRTPLSGLSPNDFGALLPSRQYVAFRRAVELLCTVAALPLLLPVMLALAAVVRFDSAGPIFYTQARVGRQGRTFRMVKFRTMLHGAEGPSFTTIGGQPGRGRIVPDAGRSQQQIHRGSRQANRARGEAGCAHQGERQSGRAGQHRGSERQRHARGTSHAGRRIEPTPQRALGQIRREPPPHGAGTQRTEFRQRPHERRDLSRRGRSGPNSRPPVQKKSN